MVYSKTVGGVVVTVEVVDHRPASNTFTATFEAPPGTEGNNQSVDWDSITKISSGVADNGCTYTIEPKDDLTWSEVTGSSDIHWVAVCTA